MTDQRIKEETGTESKESDSVPAIRNLENTKMQRPLSDPAEMHPVNGHYAPDDEDEDDDDDEDVEDDLILGDEDEAYGDEEEFDVELEDDIDDADIGENDLVIDSDDIDDEEDDDL